MIRVWGLFGCTGLRLKGSWAYPKPYTNGCCSARHVPKEHTPAMTAAASLVTASSSVGSRAPRLTEPTCGHLF